MEPILQTGETYILADFEGKIIDGVEVSYANWSLYHYIDEQINSDNPPILSTISLKKDFDNMIVNEGWEEEKHEFVIVR
jgi:hypothetical protein